MSEQFGFRAKHSTSYQRLRVIVFITDGPKSRRFTDALLLDLDRDITNHTFCDKVKDTLSFFYLDNVGVPQGSDLGSTDIEVNYIGIEVSLTP